MRKWILLALPFAAWGCFSVHSVGQDTIYPQQGEQIEVTKSRRVWFRLNFDNDFAQAAHREFLSRCNGGKIHGVSTRLSTENSFLHWYYHIRITGYCVRSSRA